MPPQPAIHRIFATGAVLALVMTTQSGCLLVAAAAVTGGTVAYVKGDLEQLVDATPDRVAVAAEEVLKEMNLSVISARGSAFDADVVARSAADAKVHVVAKARGEKASWVSVRVGVFGDDGTSARIMQAITRLLAEDAEVVATD